MNVLKAYIKYVLFHSKYPVGLDGISFLEKNYKLRPDNAFSRYVYNKVLELNKQGVQNEQIKKQ